MFSRDLMGVPSFQIIASRVRGKVVDLGCGVGYMSRLFPDYVGLDMDPGELRLARARGVARVLRGDLSRLPFRSNSFDWVLAYDVIEHADDLHAWLAEARRVARNAVYSLVDFSSYYRWFAYDETHHGHLLPQELRTALRAHYRVAEEVRTSGIFMAPRLVNRFLAARFPNQVVYFCYG